MNADVEKAVAYIEGIGLSMPTGWQDVRKALRDQEAEIARLRKIEEERWSVVAMRNSAIERAEKAEALLRGEAALLRAWAKESREGGWSTHQVGPMSRRADEITAHLGAEQ